MTPPRDLEPRLLEVGVLLSPLERVDEHLREEPLAVAPERRAAVELVESLGDELRAAVRRRPLRLDLGESVALHVRLRRDVERADHRRVE